MGFSEDVKRLSSSSLKSTEDATKRLVLDLYDLILSRTPVDTGKLRASWDITTNSNSQQSSLGQSTTTSRVQAESRLANWTPSSTFSILNLQPYARKIEYGYSRKAPTGMVRVSILEIMNRIQSGYYSIRS